MNKVKKPSRHTVEATADTQSGLVKGKQYPVSASTGHALVKRGVAKWVGDAPDADEIAKEGKPKVKETLPVSKMNKEQLMAFASKSGFPAGEWNDLNAKDLKAYVQDKVDEQAKAAQ